MRPLLVLRPEPGASATAAAALDAGLATVAAPLFAVRSVEPDWSAVTAPPDALLLTSANAARMLRPGQAPARPGGGAELHDLPLYAVGEATAAAARAAGFGDVRAGSGDIRPGSGDAAAIVARAAADGAVRLLHLAGREHHAVAHPGVAIDRVIVYAAEAVDALPRAARDALDAGAVALLHSPRAAALFARLLDEAGRVRAGVALAALSPAIAAAAGPGWAAVALADRPTDAALLAAAARLCEEAAR